MSCLPPWLVAAFAGSLIWIAGLADPLAAEEAATTIAAPAQRLAAHDVCRIVNPTFAPEAASAERFAARYPGGGKLSFAVASPCPAKAVAFDI